MSADGVCVVIGAGDATGTALAEAFAAEGLTAVMCRRPRHADALEAAAAGLRAKGLKAVAKPIDARDEDAVRALFETVEQEVGPIEVAVFNIGANVRFPIEDTTAQVYRKVWELAAFAGFLTGREAARRMAPRGRGAIFFTGATASRRGGPGYAAFAGAKHALRALAESMARELWPKGVHVAHVVIDGAIDSAFIRERLEDVEAARAADAILSPEAIAANYVRLWRQPRSAWSFEIDLRPWSERW